MRTLVVTKAYKSLGSRKHFLFESLTTSNYYITQKQQCYFRWSPHCLMEGAQPLSMFLEFYMLDFRLPIRQIIEENNIRMQLYI